MGLFSKKKSNLRKENDRLIKENDWMSRENNRITRENNRITRENKTQKNRIKDLENRCEEKDRHFISLMSDATRHRSKLGAKYMADRKKYLKENERRS